MSTALAVRTLDSPLWHRVAPLVPRLRASVRVRYRAEAGATRHLLVDRLSGRHHVVDASAWSVIGLFDGQRSLGQIWQVLQGQRHQRLAAPADRGAVGRARRLTDRPDQPGPAGTLPTPLPTQQEVIDWLVALDSAGLLLCDQTPDISRLIEGQDRALARRRRAAAHPLSWRLPLSDPSAWLARLGWLGSALCHPLAGLLWLLLLGTAALQAGMQASALQAAMAERLAQPGFLALTWAVYPVIKALHELGHALAVRHFGGEVRHVGIAFIYLIPSPYVDASAASGFASRRRRMAVSAIGMAIELALAAAGLLLWGQVESGALANLALALAIVGGVSTVIANANPLVRMDGYHLLTDALDLPNLAQRSRRHALGAVQALLLGCRDDVARDALRWRDRLLLPLYAPLAWLFGAAMGLSMALWLADRAPLAGLLVGGLTLWSMALQPALKAARWLLWDDATAGARRRAVGLSAAALAVLAAALAVPLPHATTVLGVAWVPEDALLRAGGDGFVSLAARADHDNDNGNPTLVTAGDALLSIRDEQLPLALAQAHARQLEQDTLSYALQWRDPPRAQRAAIDSAQQAAQAQALQERVDQLKLHAPHSGTLTWLQPATLAGRWVRRGEVLGHVLADAPGNTGVNHSLTVRVAIPADQWPALLDSGGAGPTQTTQATQAARTTQTLAPAVRAVHVLGPDGSAPLAAHWDGRAEAPGLRLPAAALGSAAGGLIDTDPADADGLRSLAPLVVTDVQVPGRQPQWLGQRVWVRFSHAPAALGPRWVKAAQQTLLRHLSAARGGTP